MIKNQSSSPSSIPGLRLVILLIALGLGATAWRLALRPVYLPLGTTADISGRNWPDMRLNLNAASPPELMLLPGIGPKMAESIAADREKNGPFATLEDLARVHRIGPKTIERLRPYVIVNIPDLQ